MNEEHKNNDEVFMQRCLHLAAKGLGSVSTNPLVGCVIVYNEEIIGEGYHQKYGEAHAEVNAINSVTSKEQLKESTLYVNLEPCAHYGKTPPCSDLIIANKIKRVVIGTIDTFSKVAGKGIEKLKNASLQVDTGVLEYECRDLNKRFFTYNEKQRPYLILKWAQTFDGFIGRPQEQNHLNKRISNSQTDIEVHKWRAQEDAIMVGTNTAVNDDPELTVRKWEGNNPTRVLVDYNLRVNQTTKLFNNAAPTIVVNSLKNSKKGTVFYEKVNDKSLSAILEVLYKHNIQSVIVEGGAKLLQSFINEGLWDEARVITANKNWGNGISAPNIIGTLFQEQFIEGDKVSTIQNNNFI